MRADEKILGMEIKKDRDQKKLFLCQKEYIQKVLNHFRMASEKQLYTPLTTSICLSKLNNTHSKSEKEYISHTPYASVVGSHMYVMVCTRPDLAQAFNVMSGYMGNPRKEHWKVVNI